MPQDFIITLHSIIQTENKQSSIKWFPNFKELLFYKIVVDVLMRRLSIIGYVWLFLSPIAHYN